MTAAMLPSRALSAPAASSSGRSTPPPAAAAAASLSQDTGSRRCKVVALRGARRTWASTSAGGALSRRPLAAQGSISVSSSSSGTVGTTATPASQGGGQQFGQEQWDAFITGYDSCYEERVLPVDDSMVEGTIPKELFGSYLRNGPGLLEVGGKKIPQPFDGDGMITCFSFKDGKALFQNKFVRTEAFVAEQREGRMLYQGVFNRDGPEGTWFNNPLDLEVKKVANTGVIMWGGRLLALYEADLPYELSPNGLETIGRTTLDGSVPVGQDGKAIVAAHYRVVQQADGSKRWVTFGPQVSGLDNNVQLYEFEEDGTLAARSEVLLKDAAFGFFHDMLVTERYYVLLENPIRLDVLKMITGYVPKRCAFAECLQYRPDLPSKLHLIPRPGTSAEGSGKRTFEVPGSFFSFHHINAYELPSQVVLDTVALLSGVDFSASMDTAGPDYFSSQDGVGRGTAIRLLLDTENGKVVQRKLFSRSCEFPCINPAKASRPHSVAFMACDSIDHPVWYSPPQSLAKLTLPAGMSLPDEVESEVWNPGQHSYVQEPMFVPRPGASQEDEGWVLAFVYDSARRATDLAILDAERIAEGPVATIHLPFSLPYGLHGYWSPELVGPDPEQPPAASCYDIRGGVANPDGTFKYQ